VPATLSAIILPILIVSALGFVWGRMGHQLEMTTIGTPSLVANTLTDLTADTTIPLARARRDPLRRPIGRRLPHQL
jgi:hypothetical protein